MTWMMGEMSERFPHALRLLGWDGTRSIASPTAAPVAMKLYRARLAAGGRRVGSGNRARYTLEDVRVAVVRQLLMDALQMPRALPRVLDDAIRHATWKTNMQIRLGAVTVEVWLPMRVAMELAS